MADPDPNRTPIRVGIALIGRGGCYLVRRRLAGQIMAGVWEFPGGKCEPGESSEAATARECLEEVGVAVGVESLRSRFVHEYPHGIVELSFHDVRTIDPGAEPVAGSGFVWIEARDLAGLEFPGANGPVIAALVAES